LPYLSEILDAVTANQWRIRLEKTDDNVNFSTVTPKIHQSLKYEVYTLNRAYKIVVVFFSKMHDMSFW